MDILDRSLINRKMTSLRVYNKKVIECTLPLTSNWPLFKFNISDPEQIKLK